MQIITGMICDHNPGLLRNITANNLITILHTNKAEYNFEFNDIFDDSDFN